MDLTAAERSALLSSWIKRSSDNEQTQQDRAQRMISDAISVHPAFSGTSIKVYAKGSYANNTNVRQDSDVDIVVENRDCCYFDYFGDFVHPTGTRTPYTGIWTPDLWRKEVSEAIVNCFGSDDVDTSGAVALVVAAKAGSRPSADVVPSFQYHRYDNATRTVVQEGCKVFKSSGGSIVNWPQQQLDNGRAKNVTTGQRYKNYVRALKHSENYLVTQDIIKAKPSYLMECLVWNVPNDCLTSGDLVAGFRATLVWLWEHLNDLYVREDWTEPNELKYLFHTSQKWSVADAKEVVLETWRALGY